MDTIYENYSAKANANGWTMDWMKQKYSSFTSGQSDSSFDIEGGSGITAINTNSKQSNYSGESQTLQSASGGNSSTTTADGTSFYSKYLPASMSFSNPLFKRMDSGPNYYAFAAFFGVGCLFLLLSLTFVPLILISPAKFNLFFSLGSLFLQIAMAFYYGPLTYLQIIFKRENLAISTVYVASLLFTLYASFFWGTYISALLLIAL